MEKWIEFIRVRSAPSIIKSVIPKLHKLIKDIKVKTDCIEAFSMKHAIYDGDLSVVLMWENKIYAPGVTTEGLMISEMLQNFGPIDHAVWIPVQHNS